VYWTRLGRQRRRDVALRGWPPGFCPGSSPASALLRAVGLSLVIVGVLTLTYPSRPSPIWLTALGLFCCGLLLATTGLNPTTRIRLPRPQPTR